MAHESGTCLAGFRREVDNLAELVGFHQGNHIFDEQECSVTTDNGGME